MDYPIMKTKQVTPFKVNEIIRGRKLTSGLEI